ILAARWIAAADRLALTNCSAMGHRFSSASIACGRRLVELDPLPRQAVRIFRLEEVDHLLSHIAAQSQASPELRAETSARSSMVVGCASVTCRTTTLPFQSFVERTISSSFLRSGSTGTR